MITNCSYHSFPPLQSGLSNTVLTVTDNTAGNFSLPRRVERVVVLSVQMLTMTPQFEALEIQDAMPAFF